MIITFITLDGRCVTEYVHPGDIREYVAAAKRHGIIIIKKIRTGTGGRT